MMYISFQFLCDFIQEFPDIKSKICYRIVDTKCFTSLNPGLSRYLQTSGTHNKINEKKINKK